MRKHQTGEVIVVMMVVMMVLMWFGSGHMGMRENGAVHSEKSGSTEQQTKAEPQPSSAPKGSTETQN